MATDKQDKTEDKKNPKKKHAAEPHDKAEAKPAKSAAKASAKSEGGEAKAKSDKPAKAKGLAKKRAPLATNTFFAKTGSTPEKWRLVDAAGQTLGRLSSHIALILMGKDKPTYTPFTDTGDHVIVINAEKVKLTGNKFEDKTYHYHTNYPGGIKSFTVKDLMAKHPERIIERAVWGMLPKSKGHMVRHWFGKLRVYAGTTHPHTAQTPEVVKLPNLGIYGE